MPTVLVIEDQVETSTLIKSILKLHQIDVVAFEMAQDGIDYARENPPDLILMDLLLPRMDGFTAIGIIKQDDNLRHIPVVAVTAASIANAHQRLEAVGADGFITKPFNIPDLLAQVKMFLD